MSKPAISNQALSRIWGHSHRDRVCTRCDLGCPRFLFHGHAQHDILLLSIAGLARIIHDRSLRNRQAAS
jgi:hypothetical protein